MAVPPLRVVITGSSKVMLCANWVPLTVTMPVMPFVPAEKKRSSAWAVAAVRTGEPTFAPVESVLQKTLVPQVPVAAPDPAVPVPFVSQ